MTPTTKLEALGRLRSRLGASEVANFIDRATLLSYPLGEGLGHAEVRPVGVKWRRSRSSLERYDTIVELDLHSTTHIELPWAVLPKIWEKALSAGVVQMKPPHPFSELGQDWMGRYLRARVLDALLIDVSHKKHHLLDALVAAGYASARADSGDRLTLLAEDLADCSEEELIRLVDHLRITGDDLLARLIGVEEPGRTLLIFYTGWEMFLSSAMEELAEPWHPYYFHPFLDISALSLIEQLGVAGVAADTSSLSCPLHDLGESRAPPAMRSVRRKLLGARSAWGISASLVLRPVRLRLLSQGKIYLTNLHFPLPLRRSRELSQRLSFDNDSEALSAVFGELLLIPLHVGGSAIDAAPVVAYWRESG